MCIHSLIRILTKRILDSHGCKVSARSERRLWSDCTHVSCYVFSCLGSHLYIAQDKIPRIFLFFFLFCHETICCRYPLKAPHQGALNMYRYQQYVLWRNKKNVSIIWFQNVSYLELCLYDHQKVLYFKNKCDTIFTTFVTLLLMPSKNNSNELNAFL